MFGRSTVLCAVLICAFFSAQGQRVVNLHVNSQIQSRFATTHVTSEIQNTDSEAKEITFEAQLPAEAFISNFTMTINGRLQVGEVKEKKAAKQDYERAKASGQTAGLVEQKPRETDFFRTSVNVAGGGKVKFDLTYQEVLKRVHGVYKHVINILAAEAVEDLRINVFITERGRIRDIHVPKFGPKIGEKTNKELLALPQNPDVKVRRNVVDGFATAEIKYQPTTKVAGQLAVLYDLERSFNGGDVEVVDGFIVHFFAPQRDEGQQIAGATNIVFVLDRSGSMQGRKFTQLKQAMQTILADLKPEDRFSIVWFSTEAEAWDTSLRPANNDNVREALAFVDQGRATGGTNIHGALLEALSILKQDKDSSGSTAPNMVLFLTDGLPTAGEVQDPDDIVKAVGSRNRNLKAKIHNLAFGNDADYKMMKKMSSENNGLARKIYEASDAKFQLEGFYSEIANPIFTNLDIRYLDGKVDVSSIVKNRDDDTFYEGSEVVVVAKLRDPATTTVRGEIQAQGPDGATVPFRCGNECFRCCTGFCPPWCRGWWTCDDPIPRPVRTEPALPANTLRGFVERMWGYMTIKKLLKEAEFDGDTPEGKRKKAEALRLSLHYNFVTELTSMVVVDKEADLAPIQAEDQRESINRLAGFPAPMAASFSGLAGPAGPRGGFSASRIRPFGLPGRPAPRQPLLPPPPPPPATFAPTIPPTTMPPTSTFAPSTGCQINLLIIYDGRPGSNVAQSQVLQLLQEMGGVYPGIAGNVAIAKMTGQSDPQILQDFSDYRGISSIPTRQLAGRSFRQIMRRLRSQLASRKVVLVMNGAELLPDSLLSALEAVKNRGVEIFTHQTRAAFTHPVYSQLTGLSGTDGYLFDASMNALAYALQC